MGKMKELYAEGVTDLTSYNIGRSHERDELIAMLLRAADNPDAMLLPPSMVLRVMAASLRPEEDEEE
jgi:hypothetical protein